MVISFSLKESQKSLPMYVQGSCILYMNKINCKWKNTFWIIHRKINSGNGCDAKEAKSSDDKTSWWMQETGRPNRKSHKEK